MGMTARRFDRALRDAAIIGEWLTGAPVNQIAAHHGVTAETVRAIAARTPGVVEERQRRLAEAEEANRLAVVRWSQEHQGDPIEEGAAALGVSRDQMRRWLGNRLTLHPGRPPRGRSIPDEEIVRSVRLWLSESDGDTREESYRAAAKQHGWPSAATAMDRYGTWKAVLLAAGAAPTSRRGRGPSWTDDQLVASARRYLQTQPPPWTWRGLERWLQSHPELPSAQLISKRIGSWSTIVKAASTKCGDAGLGGPALVV